MAKLIDADEMAVNEAQAYMSAQLKLKDERSRLINGVVHRKIQMLIADTPAVDAVEVVRCKDCINAEYFNGVLCCAMAHDVVRQKNDFCSYGERRTDEGNS